MPTHCTLPPTANRQMLLKAEALMRAIALDAGAASTPVLDPAQPGELTGVVADAQPRPR